MEESVVASASLCPPPEPAGVLDGSSGVLLQKKAYIAARVNATTARGRTRCGNEIQVTLCLADPPRVSYVCVHCPTAVFFCEPVVVAMEGDLLLLSLMLAPASALYDHDAWHYFVYKASCSPSLLLLPLPQFDDAPARSCVLFRNEVGLLRTNSVGGGDGDGYIIAFLQILFPKGKSDICWVVRLCLFDSSNGDGEWKSKPLQADPQIYQIRSFFRPCSKVLAIGGQAGTMAWVNFENGISLCDVLQESPILRYIPLPLPPPLLPGACFDSSSQTRDIAVVHGRIKFVDIIFRLRPEYPTFTTYKFNGWVAVTWSRKAAAAADADAASSSWQLEDDHILNACDINPSNIDSLPKLQGDDGEHVTTLETYHVGHPTVSLHDSNTVYFMAKVRIQDDDARVLSVDMKDKMVQGVAEFATTRTLGMRLVYSHSRISEFLQHSGTQDNLKIPGILKPEGSHNKMPLIEEIASSFG